MDRRNFLTNSVFAGTGFAIPSNAMNEKTKKSGTFLNVYDFGAKGDGKSKDTIPLQKAIDACNLSGGGTVLFPHGRFISGTLMLKSNVEIHLSAGAILQASRDRNDFIRVHPEEQYMKNSPVVNQEPFFTFTWDYHLIVAQEAENVTISGAGTIFGNGLEWMGNIEEKGGQEKYQLRDGWRPGPLVAFDRCRGIRLENITIRESYQFHSFFIGCSNVYVKGVTIQGDKKIRNGDGLHITCCRDVIISDCNIAGGDDAISIFTFHHWLETDQAVSENIAISNCLLSSDHSGIRLGYTGDGILQNISCNNIIIREAFTGIDIVNHITEIWEPYPEKNKNFYRSGPQIKNISFSNLNITADWGITANLYENTNPPAAIKDISFSNIQIRCTCGNYFLGSPGKPVKDIRMDAITVMPIGEREDDNFMIPDPARPSKSKTLQISHAFAFRNIDSFSIRSVRIEWEHASGFWKTGLYFENAKNVFIDGIITKAYGHIDPVVIYLKNSESVHVFNTIVPDGTAVFAEISGSSSKRITFMNCEPERINKMIKYSGGALLIKTE